MAVSFRIAVSFLTSPVLLRIVTLMSNFPGRVANTKDIIQFKNVRGRTGVKVEQNTSMKVDVDEAMTDQVGTMKDVVVKVSHRMYHRYPS